MKVFVFRYQIATMLVLTLILMATACDTRQPSKDPVALSEVYQPWDATIQPENRPAWLGLGSYAKVLCSAVFVSGRDPEEAFANSGRIILDRLYHDDVSYTLDRQNKQVTMMIGDSIMRSATYHGDQGCIIDHPDGLQFTPVEVTSGLPHPDSMDWPMGDQHQPDLRDYPVEQLRAIRDAAFQPNALTAAFLVVHRGQIILEAYGQGAHQGMQLESWSMGKSLTATLIGRLIQQGKLSLDQQAPVSAWSKEGDPRARITIKNLLQMSSGLRFPAHRDPEVTVPLAQLAHMYVYCAPINAFDFAVNRPLEFIPGSTGRYRNCDPLTLGMIVRETVEAEGRNYWRWPQEELFDAIGIRKQVMETDPYGNFLLTGFDYGTARNWARLGMLYLQDGVWQGKRLLPEGFSSFVAEPASGWESPIYGGLFWLNGTGTLSLPPDAYYMAGGGGQRTIIVPSLELVVVRMGHSAGAAHVEDALNNALSMIVDMLADQ